MHFAHIHAQIQYFHGQISSMVKQVLLSFTNYINYSLSNFISMVKLSIYAQFLLSMVKLHVHSQSQVPRRRTESVLLKIAKPCAMYAFFAGSYWVALIINDDSSWMGQ